MSRTRVAAADVSASDVLTAPPAARVTRRSPARFVLLGGVPGAGTTTLIRRMAGDLPHVRTVDPDDLRRKIASVVPTWVPYRCYRAVAHTLTAVQVLVLLLFGPRASTSLVVHDPATRPLRRWLTGRLAQWRGCEPALVMLDVSRESRSTTCTSRQAVPRAGRCSHVTPAGAPRRRRLLRARTPPPTRLRAGRVRRVPRPLRCRRRASAVRGGRRGRCGMTTPSDPSRRRPGMALREGGKVKFLELFFDLVFVLAFTQCTALMVEQHSWPGIAQGMLVLAVLWWSWAGYAWLTSVLDPDEGAVRFAMFGAMAALVIVGLAVPEAFGDLGLMFAIAYGVVRIAHLLLFVLASRDDPNLRQSVTSLAVSSVIGIGLLTTASFLDGIAQGAVWALAVAIDLGGPALFGVAGWRLVPAHFAERHGLVIILALGESIVVLGIGAELGLDAPVVVAVILGVALASALWWIYFDVVALITERRLTQAAPGRERNALARDSYSYLHLPMVAGIVLVAYGLESTVAHVDEPLDTVQAFALLGGAAIYLLAHVALRLRNARSLNLHRLVIALVLLVLVPFVGEVPSLAALAGVVLLLWLMIALETRSYGEARHHLRLGHPAES